MNSLIHLYTKVHSYTRSYTYTHAWIYVLCVVHPPTLEHIYEFVWSQRNTDMWVIRHKLLQPEKTAMIDLIFFSLFYLEWWNQTETNEIWSLSNRSTHCFHCRVQPHLSRRQRSLTVNSLLARCKMLKTQ